MVCCLAAPSHYLNQCWLIIKYICKKSLAQQWQVPLLQALLFGAPQVQWQARQAFWIVSKTSYLIWANGWCSGSWGSWPHTWLATVNWWFMQAAGPCVSPIRPIECIVPLYWTDISKTVTFTATWSKLLVVVYFHRVCLLRESPQGRLCTREQWQA